MIGAGAVGRARAGWHRLGRRRRYLPSGLLATVVAVFVVLAVMAEGSPNSDVDLNDGSVWVTNTDIDRQLLGRLNPQIQELDLGIPARSTDFDVFQNEDKVFLYVSSGGRSLRQIDVAAGSAAINPIELNADTKVAFGRDSVALLDTESGKGWLRTSETFRGFVQDDAEPDVDVGRGGALAVGTDGTGWFVSRKRRTVTPVTIDQSGLPVRGTARELGSPLGDDLEVTAVGDVPVILDVDAGRLIRPDADPLRVPSSAPESVRLQQPGPASDRVYVATDRGLLAAKLDGGGLDEVRGGVDGPPAAPVVLDGYVHAAWADPKAQAYVRVDASSGDIHAEAIPGVTDGAKLVFRTNRDVVVLNDILSGVSWLVQVKGLPRVNNWDSIDPSKSRQPDPDPDPNKKQKPKRTEHNHKPKAVDDRLGARPGQDTLLPVTRNDLDRDGDILTVNPQKGVKQTSGGPKAQRVAIVGDGTQIQVRFGPNDRGTANFTYTTDDGRENGTDEGVVTVPIVPADQNSPPRAVRDGHTPRRTRMTIDRGRRGSVFVLNQWTDDEGDALVLKEAKIAKGGRVTFRPDGMLQFADDGKSLGMKTIKIVVSDGHEGDDTSAQVDVRVSGRRGSPPDLLPDRAVGIEGRDIFVEPLRNDASRDGSELRLRDVAPQAEVETTKDAAGGTFVARASKAGTYYLDYSAYTERASAKSFVRLDVLPKPGQRNLPPVATKDQGLIPPGGVALIDLLANDHDPEDGVLAVTEVDAHGAAVKASLLQNRMLRVEATRDLALPVAIDYTVSDGVNEAHASATVGQATDSAENGPPIAADDRVKVRAGAVASVAVLANDFDPDGDELELLQSDLGKLDGVPLYVQGDELRFRAPRKAGELRVPYGVRDRLGQRDDGELVIDVRAEDRRRNARPLPKPVTARAIGAHPVRIGLGLQTADPDGDAVSIRGVQSSPQLGRISRTGLDWIEYEGFPTKSGTDSFEIEVQDKYGATGLLEVKVCVVPQTPVNQPPTALADHIRVRPDRVIQYDVLANDSDPDGDRLRLSLAGPVKANHGARAKGRFVTVQVPSVDGGETRQVAAQYEIADGLGGSDSARFTVDTAKDAPLHAPITRDDFADPSKIAGRSPGDIVTVDALANDGDLDGRKSDLKLVAFDRAVSSVKDGKLRVTLRRTDQVVAYEVRDSDDISSYGFVFLQGTDTVPPTLNPKAVPLKVKAGRSIDIDLADVVLVRRGRRPIITAKDTVESAPFASGAKVLSRSSIKLTAPVEYAGAAAVRVEVTDGESLNDPSGLSSYLTIPVDVIGAPAKEHNEKPRVRDVTIQLPADKEKRFDLSSSASDPNPDDNGRLKFSAASARGVRASISDGHWLVLKAGDGAEKGDTAEVRFTVTDPQGASARGIAHVTVVKSDKPLVTVGRIGPIEAEAGKPVQIDVNEYASNTYDASPLQVSAASRESGDGTASASGSTVTVTPAAKYSGTMSVVFTVLDGSGDPDREVTGRIEVSVSAPPDAPGQPSVSATTASTATVNWSPPADNGAPITGYEVAHSAATKSCGTATTCEVTGLTPGRTYSFTVTATNKVGTSEQSAGSAPVTPDKVPERMARPEISLDYTQRDRQLILSWTAPANEGSAIKDYEILLVGTQEIRHATGSPFTWTGLTNGTSAQFEIRAVNDINVEQRKQQFSDPSDPQAPFGVPSDVGKPTAIVNPPDDVAGGIVTVNWTAPADNGDPVDKYKLVMFKDGAQSVIKEVTGTSDRFEGVENGHDYTFAVSAHNRAGFSASASEGSDKVNPYDRASAVQNLRKVSEADKQAVVSFTAPSDDGGRDITGYRISSTDGATSTVSGAGQTTVNFSANNGPYTVTVTPITSNGGAQVLGKPDNLTGVRPFGDPFPPAGGGAGGDYRSVSFSGWSAPALNGRRIVAVQHDNGGWTNGTSTSVGTAQGGDQACINIRTVSEGLTSGDRLTSAPRQLCGTAAPRTVTVSFSPGARFPNCSTAECDWIAVSVAGFRSGASYTFTPDQATGPGAGTFPSRTMGIGSDGRGSTGNAWYTGCPQTVTAVVDGISGSGNPPAPNYPVTPTRC